MKKICKSTKGFTLVELIIVIAIIGILAGFAVPRIHGFQDKSKEAITLNNTKQFTEMVLIYSINFHKDDWYGAWNENGTDTLNNYIEYDFEIMRNGHYSNNHGFVNPISNNMSVLDYPNTFNNVNSDAYRPSIFMTSNTTYAYDGSGSTEAILGTIVSYFHQVDGSTDYIEVYYIKPDGSKSELKEIIN